MHLSALKDLRSTFELESKDTNTLGKAIFLDKVDLDNHLVAQWSMRVLNTFATFLLLSYSKLLLTSIRLLLAFQSHNIYGEKVLSSSLLLYDPTIRFFHIEHVPYAVVALLVILIFIILPPILLLVYPTVMFKKIPIVFGISKVGYSSPHHGYISRMVQGWN